MRLTKIEAKDFISYAALDLDLSDVEQVVVVGQNGHGKSALLDAILWCLYGEGRGSADQMVRHGALSSWVKTTWLVGGNEVVVSRHRSMETKAGESSLHLTVDGQAITRHTIAETQEAIDRIVGLPARALLAGPFMVQGMSDTLMRARPAERKDLVIKLLDLDRFEAYHAKAKDAWVRVSSDMEALDLRIEEAEEELQQREGLDAQLETEREELATVTIAVADATEAVTNIREEAARVAERAARRTAIDNEIHEANADMDTWVARGLESSRLLAEQRAAMEMEPEEPPYQDVRLLDELVADAKDELDLAEEEVSRVTDDHAALSTRRLTLKHLEDALAIREGKDLCDTCPFVESIDMEQVERLRALTQQELPSLEDTRQKARALRVRLAELERSRSETQRVNELLQQEYESALERRSLAGQMVEQTERQLEERKANAERANLRIAALREERLRLGLDTDTDSLAQKLQEATARLTTHQQAMKSLERSVQSTEMTLAGLNRLLADHARWTAERKTLDTRASVLATLTKAWHRDGVPTLILENAVPAIESRANELLAKMPGDYAVRFLTQRAKKSGGMIETLDVSVETEGQERDYDLLSGGERFRVDLALRVAMAELLARRSGTKVETLWLDEPLAALDANGRDSVVSALAAIEDEFGLVVVVSHHDEFNDRFPARIEVVKEDNVSKAFVF